VRHALTVALLGSCALAGSCSRKPDPGTVPEDAGSRASAAPTPSAPPSGPPPLAKEEVVTLMEALGRIHAEHAKDCGRLTTELEAFEGSRSGELVRAAPAAYAEIEVDPPLSERLGRAMETIMTVSMGCANEPRFAALHARRQGELVPVQARGAPPTAPAPSR
jgi:hypothetical protein